MLVLPNSCHSFPTISIFAIFNKLFPLKFKSSKLIEESQKRFDKLHEILVKIEKRLRVIEDSVRKDKPKKYLLKD